MAQARAHIPPESSQFVSAASLRLRLDWFNKLRWGAVLGALATAFISRASSTYSPPFASLLVLVVVLGALNTAYVWRNRRIPPTDIAAELKVVKLQMLGDLLVLTMLLNLTGGIENPLQFLYVIHVVIASLLFKGREIFQIAALAIALFCGSAIGERLGVLPHYHIPSASPVAHELPFLLMSLSSFCLVMLVSAYIGARIMKHNRSIKDELVARQGELIEADQAKMNFFRFVTHEVKSPISTAQSAVETALELGGARMEPAIEDLLSRAVGRLEQASGMVRDLADLTRTGKIQQEHLRWVDLLDVTNRVVAQNEDTAARRGQKIAVEAPEAGLQIVTMPSMIEKIVANLVGNAVRYNKDGGRVTVRLQTAGDRTRIEVQDEGIGIAPDEQERVFDEFYRSQAAIQMTNLGTGLGLPLVKKFVADLGGSITLESTVGVGSRFSVELPKLQQATNGNASKG